MSWNDVLTGFAKLEAARRGVSPDVFTAQQQMGMQNQLLRAHTVDILTNGDPQTKEFYYRRLLNFPLTIEEQMQLHSPTGPGASNNGGAQSIGGVGDQGDSGQVGGQEQHSPGIPTIQDRVRQRMGLPPGSPVGISLGPTGGATISMPPPQRPISVPVGSRPIRTPGGYPAYETPPRTPEQAILAGGGAGQTQPPPGRTLTPPGGPPGASPAAPQNPQPQPSPDQTGQEPAVGSIPSSETGLPSGVAEQIANVNAITKVEPSQLKQSQGIKNAYEATKDLDNILKDPNYDGIVHANSGEKAAAWGMYRKAGSFGLRQLYGEEEAARWNHYLRTTGYLNATGGAPLLNGIRRGDIVNDIRVHLGTPWDEYEKLIETRDTLLHQYPNLLAEIPVGSGGAQLPFEPIEKRTARANAIANSLPALTGEFDPEQVSEKRPQPGAASLEGPGRVGGRKLGKAPPPLTPSQRALRDRVLQ